MDPREKISVTDYPVLVGAGLNKARQKTEEESGRELYLLSYKWEITNPYLT